MKFTYLPPQKAPSTLTARRAITSLGEHMLAFMNRNNRQTWLAEETPEEPVEEELAALFLVVVADQLQTIKLAKRARSALAIANTPLCAAEYYARRTASWRELSAEMLAEFKPTFDIETFFKDVDWDFRKRIVSSRVHFSYQAAIEKIHNQL